MILYLSARTGLPDLTVDFIEVRLAAGEIVSLTWDESEYGQDEDVFTAKYKGVYFGENYANGRMEELHGMEIAQIGVNTEYGEADKAEIEIMEMEFEDNGICYKPECLPFTIAVKECERT
ncbi:hypothetical protein D3Z47_02280 [Lachnospiraceae bacterium]|nr:hypothetical protein [Lachnospiraceae bacterium]